MYDLVVVANQRDFRKATPAVTNPMLPLPGLSPVGAKKIIAQFDGGLLSSDAGVLILREVEQRLRVAERMAACIVDPRAPEQTNAAHYSRAGHQCGAAAAVAPYCGGHNISAA